MLNRHIKIKGAGEPIIFFNGLFQGQSTWNQLADRLAKKFLVITFDFPNQWDCIDDPEIIDPDEYLTFAKSVIDYAGIDVKESTAFGICWGGHVIRALHNTCEVNFDKVILGSIATPASKKYSVLYLNSLLDALESNNLDEFVTIIAFSTYTSDYFSRFPHLLIYMKRAFRDRYANAIGSLKALIHSSIALNKKNDVSHEYRCPTHFIAGEYDIASPWRKQYEYAMHYKANSFTKLPCGHLFFNEMLTESEILVKKIMSGDVSP